MGIGDIWPESWPRRWMADLENFYEFVMPAIDIIEEGNDLVVTIDLPGFVKKDINLRIIGNILYITAKREQWGPLDTVYYMHRPLKIDKRVMLPISLKKEEEKVEGKATYKNGIVTLRIPIPKSTNIPIT
jgi:HSP20 family protein